MENYFFKKIKTVAKIKCLWLELEGRIDDGKLSNAKEREARQKVRELQDVEMHMQELFDYAESCMNHAYTVNGTNLQQALEIRELKKENEIMRSTLKEMML